MAYKDNRLRVILTLTTETHEALRRAAKAAGSSMGGLAGQFIEEARPVFEGMAGVMEKAKDQRLDAFEDLQKLLTASVADGQQLAVDMGDFHRSATNLHATQAAIAKKKKAARGKST